MGINVSFELILSNTKNKEIALCQLFSDIAQEKVIQKPFFISWHSA